MQAGRKGKAGRGREDGRRRGKREGAEGDGRASRGADGSDKALVAAITKGIGLYHQHHQLLREAEEDAGGPCDMPAHVEQMSEEMCKIFIETRRAPVHSFEGLAAKAALFAALDDGTSIGFETQDYPLDCGDLARCICHDITKLAQDSVDGQGEALLIQAWRSLPEDERNDLLGLILIRARSHTQPQRAN